MKRRCNNPGYEKFHLYGGRGVRVCNKWLNDFAAFLADVGPRPSPKHTLDRFPNQNGNYEPGNVRWATNTEQLRNTRYNRLLTHEGRVQCLSAWAEEKGLSYSALFSRLDKRWPVSLALTAPRGYRPSEAELLPEPEPRVGGWVAMRNLKRQIAASAV